MVVTLVFWIYIFLLSLVYGWQVSFGLGKLFGGKQPNIWIQWLLGIVVITTIATFFSLIIPIGLLAHVLILAGGITIFILNFAKLKAKIVTSFSRAREFPWSLWILTVISILTTLVIATRIPTNPDSGQYHAQAIRWIESFRVVPGLGNLLTRYAFNSNWFVTNAVFSLAFLGGQSFHLVPSVLFLVGLAYTLLGLSALLKKDFSLINIFRSLLLPVFFILIPSEVSSPGTDLPITIMTWIAIGEAIGMLEVRSENSRLITSILWIISVFCFTVKLSSVILVMGALVLLLVQKGEHKTRYLLWNLVFASITLVPWLIRNVIISGYLIYPFPMIDLFRLDWKIPLVNAYSDMHAIQNTAKSIDGNIPLSGAVSFFAWVPNWWRELTLVQHFILISVAITPAILFILWFFKSKFKLPGMGYSNFLIMGFIYLGTFAWFITAPDLRFGYGFIMAAFILACASVMLILVRFSSFLGRIIPAFLLVIFSLYIGYVLVRSVEYRTLKERLVLPADYPHLPSQPCRIRKAMVLTPAPEAYSECWYKPFPCTPHCEKGIEMRGESLQDGYRWP
jgi:hypothetical protein